MILGSKFHKRTERAKLVRPGTAFSRCRVEHMRGRGLSLPTVLLAASYHGDKSLVSQTWRGTLVRGLGADMCRHSQGGVKFSTPIPLRVVCLASGPETLPYWQRNRDLG
jgi:hypothetical protein